MTYSQIFTQVYGQPGIPILSDTENKCLCNLTFYPEDIDVNTNVPVVGFDKCLAIAIYDWNLGAVKQNDLISQDVSNHIFQKLFGFNLANLF